MVAELTPGARKQAHRLRRELLRGQPIITFSGRDMRRRKSLAQLQQWCDEQGIGAPLRPDGGWSVDHDTLQQLEQALQALGLAPLDAELAATRIGRLQQGAQEFKTLGEAPLQHRLLCSFRLAHHPVAVRNPPARWVLDIDWRQLDLNDYAGLLVIENADVFYTCGSADWPLPGRFENHLVAYRGHDHRAQGLKALQQAWHGIPQIYFGDVDPKGLSIALQEGYSHVLLPALTEFQRAATALHAPAAQEPSQRWLAAHSSSLPITHPLHGYMRILVSGRGLLQQAAVSMPMVSIEIA